MISTRRTFLAGLGAALAAPAVIRTSGLLMPVRAPIPTLWGDGRHCDAEAIQALVDGMKVIFRGAIMRPLHRRVLLPEAANCLFRASVYIPALVSLDVVVPLRVVSGPGTAAAQYFADGSVALGASSAPRVQPL